MNDFDLCFRSYQGHVNHCVTFDVEYDTIRYNTIVEFNLNVDSKAEYKA